jgi:hypothetical protein
MPQEDVVVNQQYGAIQKLNSIQIRERLLNNGKFERFIFGNKCIFLMTPCSGHVIKKSRCLAGSFK